MSKTIIPVRDFYINDEVRDATLKQAKNGLCERCGEPDPTVAMMARIRPNHGTAVVMRPVALCADCATRDYAPKQNTKQVSEPVRDGVRRRRWILED